MDRTNLETTLRDLMIKSQDGDKASYTMLLTKMSDPLRSFVKRSMGRMGLGADSAYEDVLQEVLLAIHLKRANYDPTQLFTPWMYAIARYKVIDYLRRKSNDQWRNLVPIEDSILEMDLLTEGPEHKKIDVETAMSTLSEKQQKLLRMIKVEGCSIQEAASQTGLSASDIKVTVHRALKILRKEIEVAQNANG
jgi:RNA polymerase sigma-70 factor, ECF subfamily